MYADDCTGKACRSQSSLKFRLTFSSFIFLRQESNLLQQPQCFQTRVILRLDHGKSKLSLASISWYLSVCCYCTLIFDVYLRERMLRECLSHPVMMSSESCPGHCGRRWACPCLGSMSSSTTKQASMPSLTSMHSLVGTASHPRRWAVFY